MSAIWIKRPLTISIDPESVAPEDRGHMALAIGLGGRNLGQTWPNPAVGCVLVGSGGRIVGRGWTARGGRPHAETEALKQAGAAARGATAYVSLEPCSHHGRTGPCARALIDAGVVRVVVSCADPDPRVAGQGIAMLRKAGVPVVHGLMEAEGLEANRGFISRVSKGRPFIALKLATSLDGRIATKTGESRWITGPLARQYGHLLRSRHDAVMIGRGTAATDDPLLTCRLRGLENRSPVRVICDTHMRIGVSSAVVATAETTPTWIMTANDDSSKQDRLRRSGVEVVSCPPGPGQTLDLQTGMGILAARGITRLLVEGGGVLAGSLVRSGLVDRIHAIRAGSVIGGDGISAIGAFELERLSEMTTFVRREVRSLGPDQLEIWDKIENG